MAVEEARDWSKVAHGLRASLQVGGQHSLARAEIFLVKVGVSEGHLLSNSKQKREAVLKSKSS